MKYLFIIFFIPTILFSQEYFFLDSLRANYKVNEFSLDTKELYPIKKDINIYNVFTSDTTILLISVLPDLEEIVLPGMNEIGENWMSINYDEIKGKILSNKNLLDLTFDWESNNVPERKTFRYQLVKKKNGKYYVSKICLTELFTISPLEFPFISSYGTINIAERKVSVKEMYDQYKKRFKNQDFIMDVRTNYPTRNISNSYSLRNYLSKEFYIKDKLAYQFWTFDGWWAQDGYNEHRGIDRFLYIPDLGIVGGSYDFYFKHKPKLSRANYYQATSERLWNNIVNEHIMIAKELK